MRANFRFSIRHLFSTVYLFLFGVALFIRFPFFFRDIIDHDESTFIFIGNSIADGYLPYDYLWDLKPPLLFYVFGLVEYIFPHSLIAIRGFGVIIIFLSSLFLLQIAKTISVKNGFVIALSYIVLSSMFGSIQCVMSEHVAVFFFLPGLLFFLKSRTTLNFLLAGFFFGCALLCKMNFACTVLALLLYYIIFYHKEAGIKQVSKNSLLIIGGISIPFILIAVPYIIANKLKLLIDSVFMATFEYGNNMRASALYKLAITWWIIVIGLLISFLALKLAQKENRKTAGLFVVMLMATIITFYSNGIVNGHYLIQIFPFISLLFFVFILKREFKPRYLKFAFLILLLSVESYQEYYRIAKQYSVSSTLYNGKAFTTIHELKMRHLENRKIFFANYHIGQWFLHKYPLTKSITHPTSLSRPFLFKYFGNNRNSLQELTYIMEETKPEVIVSRQENLSLFLENSSENLYFESRMKNYFNLVYSNTKENIFIWQKIDN